MGVKKKKKVTEVVKNNFKNEKAPGGGVFLTQILKKRYGGPIQWAEPITLNFEWRNLENLIF